MVKINQCSLVLNQLMRSGKISVEQARSLGIKSLSARVKELRLLGIPIENASDGGYILPYWLQKSRGKKKSAQAGTSVSELF